MNDLYYDAGQRIRDLREKQQLTREYLAEQADISPKFLYEIEYGYKGFSAHTLYKLSKALSIDCNYILMGPPDIKKAENIESMLELFNQQQIKKLQEILISIYALVDSNT